MNRNFMIVAFILCIWFVISFVTNIIGPLMPTIIDSFGLNLALAGFLPFSFFLAYGIVSIPAGVMIEKIGPQKTMLAAFLLNFSGALMFSVFPYYLVAVGALFIIGLGMAMLQVVINPLMRTAGGEEHFAFFSVMAQLVFGFASFVSPFAFSHLMKSFSAGDNAVTGLLDSITPAGLPWVSFYWFFAVIFIALIVITRFIHIPKVELSSEERAGSFDIYISLLKQKQVRLFFLGIVAYVGTEQSLANWMSQFLASYHNVDPVETGASTVGFFWGLMSVGCILGLLLLKILDSRVVLKLFSTFSILSVALALFGPKAVSLLAFPASGFFISVMFSIIFSLALNSLPSHHGAFSGILCSGILGGALVPFVVGVLGDWVGLKAALCGLFVTIGFIMSIGYWANPLVKNDTVDVLKLLRASEQS